MATIQVCDRCGGSEDVLAGHEFDLCPGCAFAIVVALSAGDCRAAVLDLIQPGHGQGEPTARPTVAAPVTARNAETTAFQARVRLEQMHGTSIYRVTPEEPVEPRKVIVYGAERKKIEILEPVPGEAGKWFARIVE